MNRAGSRSLALHRAVADKLRRDPALWSKVFRNVERMLGSAHGGLAHPWGQHWQERLTAPHEDVLSFLVEDSPLAQQFRSSSPFAGVLTAKERAGVLAALAHETLAA